jgi:hypothetical protein
MAMFADLTTSSARLPPARKKREESFTLLPHPERWNEALAKIEVWKKLLHIPLPLADH